MASVKIFSLVVKTFAKPIANTIKAQATQHETFRNFCIGLAQRMHRTEARLRMGLLNEEAKNIKPLNDTRAVQNGATTLAETFLLVVGASLVLGESYRSTRKETKRRDDVADRLEALEAELKGLREGFDHGGPGFEGALIEIQEHNARVGKVLETIVANGLRSGWLSLGHKDGMEDVMPLLEQRQTAREKEQVRTIDPPSLEVDTG